MSALNSNSPTEATPLPHPAPQPQQEREDPLPSEAKEEVEVEKQKENQEATETGEAPKLLIDSQSILSRRKNIFSTEPKETVNIFNTGKSVNLFNVSQKEQFPNIFASAATAQPLVTADDDDEDEEDGSGSRLEASEDKSNTQKGEMKYDYKPNSESIAEFKLNLFRAGSKKAIESVMLFLEKAAKPTERQASKVLELVVRTVGSRNCVYQAMLLGETRCEEFMGKAENLKLAALRVGDKQEKPLREVVKMQFVDGDAAKAFRQAVSNFFSAEEKSE